MQQSHVLSKAFFPQTNFITITNVYSHMHYMTLSLAHLNLYLLTPCFLIHPFNICFRYVNSE